MIKPKALIFDVFGTVVDWRGGIAKECQSVFEAKAIAFDPHRFADLWRVEYQPAMQRIRSGNRGYVDLDILHRENLERVLEKTNLSSQFSDIERDQLNHAWEKLPPWPDSLAGLTALRKKYIVATCSNGSIALMTELANFGNLPWDAILGAEIAQAYKPDPQVYLKSAEKLGLQPTEVMMVAAHNDDLVAARDCGLQTAFIPRPTEYGPGQTLDLVATGAWDIISEDLKDVENRLSTPN